MKYWTSCQNLSDNFRLAEDNLGIRYIMIKGGGLKIRIKKDGYIPRSGLFLAETIDGHCEVNNKSVLDIGTGETGFLAYFARFKDASRVMGSDLDIKAIQHACQAGDGSNEIEWAVGNVYGNIPPEHFDFIVSNPPQMPSLNTNSLHDYGGPDGRDVILKILYGSDDYLAVFGKIIILCFDFLGIDRRTNDQPTIKEISCDLGYRFRELKRRVQKVRKG